MAGFGSPCGACKFLRRKCVRGCVFAPYFCHEQGATHFAAIHKVFGASNVSKLLTHLPITDRNEAAVTISYEAQARVQDPIYGCVSHIFALQQQVVNLQAQLASLSSTAQASQDDQLVNGSIALIPQEDKLYATFPSYPHDDQGFFHFNECKMPHTYAIDNNENMLYCDNGFINPNPIADYNHSVMSTEENVQFPSFEDPSHSMASLDMQMNNRKWAFQDTEDLHEMGSLTSE
ncbi:Lob domain-containing protein crl1 [Thalictrum thalictroides]|uniref:Lob domain-containing protein crl1 n=1 Tax=Thalictrum thalictroides TaxID=46969 RepID=A0A7J6UXL7_THATH|nr:Lob domain-containing protein crl1 [Thalictrum thalictroides]